MHCLDELEFLLDLSKVHRMTDGYHVAIRAELVDCTDRRPHGIDYGLQLMDPNRERVLGFDNRHAYTGAAPDAPYDHEHRHGVPRVTFGYAYRSAYELVSDFYQRVEDFIDAHERATGVRLQFLEEGAPS